MAFSLDNLDSDGPVFSKPQKYNWIIHIRIQRNTFIAFVLSLLLHGLFFYYVPKIQFDTQSAPAVSALVVNLVLPASSVAPVKPELPASATLSESPPKEIKKEEKRPPKPPKLIKKPNEIVANPIENVVPPVPTTKQPNEIAPPKTQPSTESNEVAPITDMASYVKAQQAKHKLDEADAAKQNAEAVAREKMPSPEQLREERMKKNLQSGTNGIFEVISLSQRQATFTFRGWTNDYSSARRETYQVESKSGEDVRLVMIRKMIALIREHYQGDFNWQSSRLNRTVVMSARPQDNDGLEDFMMKEFFGSRYKDATNFLQ